MGRRIRVDPDRLRHVGGVLSRASEDLHSVERRVKSATSNMDWEIRSSGHVDGQANEARRRVAALAEQLSDLARYLNARAQAFEEADRRSPSPIPPQIRFERPGSSGGSAFVPGTVPGRFHVDAPGGGPEAALTSVAAVVGIIGLGIIGAGAVLVPGVFWDRKASATASDRDQVETAMAGLKDLQGLKPDKWSKLTGEERLQVLQTVENKLAEAQGRPAVTIELADLDANQRGEFSDNEKIRINKDHLSSGDLHSVLDTVGHEGRHAYQWWVVQNKGVEEEEQRFKEWSDNVADGNYLRAEEVGFRRYRLQPVEYDAFRYGDLVADKLAPQWWGGEVWEETEDWWGIRDPHN
ncbi:MAG TPA: WXG100 family type VII secretion target [Anaerolineae bacterium]|nr:WXG100 family type VII secretion target [Anaerolineae bacterium]HOU23464.1 WXG100 family type VII secretion target [Anaerolineae bacterium]HQJ50659.1 WXG100 family type VII secretion target [Anaerolineae bacterium]